MPSIISHPAVPLALFPVVASQPRASRLLAAGIVASVLPDADVIGLQLGVRYGAQFGHRGFTHSILFAAIVAIAAQIWWARGSQDDKPSVAALAFLLVCALSHGVLDACTTGGSGVAFFWPLSTARHFLPWRPILVSPIGVHAFLSARGKAVLLSEVVWMWLPAAAVATLTRFALTRNGARSWIENVRFFGAG